MKILCPHCGEQFEMGAEHAEHIRAQVRTAEFDKEVAARVGSEKARMAAESERHIEKLRNQMDLADATHARELSDCISGYGSKIAKLEAELEQRDRQEELAVRQARQEAEAALRDEISGLRADLAAKGREVEYYRDLKARMSTKMVGETLEQHCETEFNKLRMAAFPHAEFHKDNEVSAASGSKGDYIYREHIDGTELLSIMFEMKNDMETTAARRRNEQFLKELDKDRREKGCEYAVLVTMLEPDSDLYNQGIVDVSWQYPKMYVIRPQFFIPMITLLRNAALSAFDAKRQLGEMRRQDMELTGFREAFTAYRDGFGYNLEQAGKRQDEAIEEIDKAIRRLETAKEALKASGKQMSVMGRKVSGMTVEKLCSESPGVLRAMDGE